MSIYNNSVLNRAALAKKAETLFLNLSDLIERRGLNHIGFVTLTFKENLTCRREAQRRFNNLASNVLRSHCVEFVCAVERQRRGAIHYHLVVAFPYDIRSGFNFDACRAAVDAKRAGDWATFKACERQYFASANKALRDWWAFLRIKAEAYGFGRCETLPILSNSQALARYVGSYVSSEFAGRESRDKGLRTIRYSLDRRAASVRWSWAKGPSETFRRGCAVLSVILGRKDFAEALGRNWGWHWQKAISAFGRHSDICWAVLKEQEPRGTLEQRCAAAAKMASVIFTNEAAGNACQAG